MRPAGGGLRGNATTPSQGPGSADVQRPAGGALDHTDDLRGPRRSQHPSAPPDSSSRRRRGLRARVAGRTPAHQRLERQLTQAPGTRADVTPGHVCDRPGARGLAEPPCAEALAPPDSARLQLAAQRAAYRRRFLPGLRARPAPVSMPGSSWPCRVCFSGLGRGPPFGKASPKSSGHTRESQAEGPFRRGGDLGSGRGRPVAGLDRSEKTERFSNQVESPAHEVACCEASGLLARNPGSGRGALGCRGTRGSGLVCSRHGI